MRAARPAAMGRRLRHSEETSLHSADTSLHSAETNLHSAEIVGECSESERDARRRAPVPRFRPPDALPSQSSTPTVQLSVPSQRTMPTFDPTHQPLTADGSEDERVLSSRLSVVALSL